MWAEPSQHPVLTPQAGQIKLLIINQLKSGTRVFYIMNYICIAFYKKARKMRVSTKSRRKVWRRMILDKTDKSDRRRHLRKVRKLHLIDGFIYS